VLQRVAACCSVLQCVAACCSVFQRVHSSLLHTLYIGGSGSACGCLHLHLGTSYCVSMCAAVRCSVLQCVAVCCSVLQCVAVCCSACVYTLQHTATVCCSVVRVIPHGIPTLIYTYIHICITYIYVYLYIHIYIYMYAGGHTFSKATFSKVTCSRQGFLHRLSFGVCRSLLHVFRAYLTGQLGRHMRSSLFHTSLFVVFMSLLDMFCTYLTREQRHSWQTHRMMSLSSVSLWCL